MQQIINGVACLHNFYTYCMTLKWDREAVQEDANISVVHALKHKGAIYVHTYVVNVKQYTHM